MKKQREKTQIIIYWERKGDITIGIMKIKLSKIFWASLSLIWKFDEITFSIQKILLIKTDSRGNRKLKQSCHCGNQTRS